MHLDRTLLAVTCQVTIAIRTQLCDLCPPRTNVRHDEDIVVFKICTYLQADEELRSQQAKHTVQLERLETEKQQLRQEIIRLQLLNKVMSHPMILLRFTHIFPWLNLLNGHNGMTKFRHLV